MSPTRSPSPTRTSRPPMTQRLPIRRPPMIPLPALAPQNLRKRRLLCARGHPHRQDILIKPEKIDEINAQGCLPTKRRRRRKRSKRRPSWTRCWPSPSPSWTRSWAKSAPAKIFRAWIDAYGEDPGMQAGAANAEIGYYVSEGASFDKAFLEAALALGKAGDVSEPVLGSCRLPHHPLRVRTCPPARWGWTWSRKRCRRSFSPPSATKCLQRRWTSGGRGRHRDVLARATPHKTHGM